MLINRSFGRLICSPSNYASINYNSARCINVINKKRLIGGRAPRRGDAILHDGPEFSFMDGRGPAPLTSGQRRRYLQNKYFTEQIIKYMKQFELAKQLKPDEEPMVRKESQRHKSNNPTTEAS